MTVNYMREAATARVGTFLKLLFRWRGSVWKTIWKELAIYLFFYFNLSVFYRFMLKGNSYGVIFELFVTHCRNLSRGAATVLSFALGFYVSQISDRWWNVFMTIPWPDNSAFQICAFLRSRSGTKSEENDRVIRKTIVRYLILCYVLVFRDISERIRRRFPTYNHLVPSLMTTSEKARIETEDIKRVYWMPIEWANQLLKKCYLKDQIDPYHYGILCETILKYREMLHNLLSFDWINVPLVYTQVVHVCTVAYFGIICFASQSINEPDSDMWINEFVIPVFAIYEFIFFVGWLKVAQVMLNPFGMDDDDFEIDMVIERNLQIGYSFVDSMYDKLPPLIYVDVAALPHTKASMALITKANPMVGSVANVDVPRAEQQVISKADVEIIRKLVGPRFGRRFHYDHSKYNNDMDRITNSPEEHDLGKKSSKSNSFLKKHIIQPNNTPNPSREHDTSVAKKVGSSDGIHGGDVIGELQKKLERHKNALHTENQHDSLEKTQSPPSRDCKTTSAQSKILNPTQFSSELIEHKNSSKPFKLGTIRHSSLQHTQKTAPNTLRESSTTALTGGWGKSEEKILEKLSTTKFNSKDKISRNGRQLHGSTENRRITEEKEILTLENPTEHSTPKLRTKLTARKKESRKKMTPKPESLLSSATPTSIKTWKSSHHLKKSK